MRVLALCTLGTSAFLALAACGNDTTVKQLPPDVNLQAGNILVLPPALQFDELMRDEQQIQTFTVRNVGRGALTVDDITIELSNAFTVLTSPTGFSLEPDESVDIQVAFTPLQVENLGQAVVWSDDPDEPETLVSLLGYGAVPELRITPDPHDFGTLYVQCSDWTPLTLENIGGDMLVIEDIAFTSSDGAMQLDDPNLLPLTLGPGQFTSVNVNFVAESANPSTGELQVLSNDPRGLVTAVQLGDGQHATTRSESFVVPTDPPVDILFAVDQSCSMDDDSALLGQNFGAFINQIDAVTQGWQIGVASVYDGCFYNGILSATTPGYQAAFAAAVTYGDDPSGNSTYSEKLYQLGQVALGKTNPGQCNAGFLRPGALLHVILVSDEEEQSPNNWASYQPIFQSYVADPTLLKVSVIVPQQGSNCGSGAGYYASANATGGLILDLCGDWSSQIGQLGAASVQEVNTFDLGSTADPSSIEVRVNGVVVTDWSYNPGTNAVVLSEAPPENATVDIDYGVIVPCPNP